MIIIEEYLKYDNLYKDKYEKYIVLLQIGSFYEIYSIVENDKKLKEICNILNIVLTRKNKKIKDVNKSNPLMCGIPTITIEKYLNILLNDNYVVIIYNQYKDNDKIKRKLDKIYSPGTYLNNEITNHSATNNIISIYIEQINKNIIIGFSLIDLTTGYNNVSEFITDDFNKLLDEINRYLLINNPKELLFISGKNKINDSYYETLFNIFKTKIDNFHYNYELLFHKDFIKVDFQNLFLHKIFSDIGGILSPIEYINMERHQYALVSYIILLNYSYNHDNLIIQHILKPEIINNDNLLILYNDALIQLDVINQNNVKKFGKYNSLFDVVNFTSTALGKRLLKYNLTNPISNIDKLNQSYNLTEQLIKNNYLKYELYLSNVLDIERYHKKLSVNCLEPFNFGKLNNSYIYIIKLINLSKKIFKNHFDYSILEEFNNFYNEYIKYFNIIELELFNYQNINTSIFNKNVFPEIDEIENNINTRIEYIKEVCKELTILADNNSIEYKKTDKDGYYLFTTNKRAKILEKNIKHTKFSLITFSNKIKSYTYINYAPINKISNEITNYNEKLNKLVIIKYNQICFDLYNKYYRCLNLTNQFIAYIDFITSNAKLASKYKYIKPIISNEKNNESFIKVDKIRHPIIERISDDVNYVTNDIDNLGFNDKKGILLYGLNFAGKSCLMKSVGLSIILSQAGLYVPCSKMIFYPFNSLFTRITKQDNLFQNKSSFIVEINELGNIFKFANSKSIVLADELLNTTEVVSAISIICSSIEHFLNKDVKFIITSHFHDIVSFLNKDINKKLYVGNMITTFKNNKIIFDRKLQDGIGQRNYGLLVADTIIKNKDFMNSAFKLQNKILKNEKLLNIKKSTYNKKKYIDYCYLCNDLDNIKNYDNIEVHHIIEQNKFNKNDIDTHIQKNDKSNLINLCNNHHSDVHNNKINIHKWVETSIGFQLDYDIF